MSGNFTVDYLIIKFPLSIFGALAGMDARNRKLPLKNESVILNNDDICFNLKSGNVAFNGLFF